MLTQAFAIGHLNPFDSEVVRKMPEYTILAPVHVSEYCFLFEALYWRAFGRIPIEVYDDEPPRRENPDNYEGIDAPMLDGEELWEEETQYAGIPVDPRMEAMLDGRAHMPVEHYEKLISICERIDPPEVETINSVSADLNDAKLYHSELAAWTSIRDAYLDEFKNELTLDLKRGNLNAVGRKLPDPSPDKSYAFLDGQSLWFDSIQKQPIPSAAWLTRDVNWSASAIFGDKASYIWIQIPVAELLTRYPPEKLIKPECAFPIGSIIAVTGMGLSSKNSVSNRGRPPLPWDQFHVQVAKLYATGMMLEKKEAAIAQLQEWTQKTTGIPASRPSVGAKLKPYFDTIGKNP